MPSCARWCLLAFVGSEEGPAQRFYHSVASTSTTSCAPGISPWVEKQGNIRLVVNASPAKLPSLRDPAGVVAISQKNSPITVVFSWDNTPALAARASVVGRFSSQRNIINRHLVNKIQNMEENG